MSRLKYLFDTSTAISKFAQSRYLQRTLSLLQEFLKLS